MIGLLQDKFALSEQGAKNLIKGIVYSVLVNISLMFPVALLALVINSFMWLITKEEKIVNWGIPTYIFTGVIILAVIFIFHYLQYSATYIGTYDESKRRRISISEKIRTLPLSFFGERNTADLTGIIMSDCASFEHAFSHSVPQFFGAVISTIIVCVTLLCVNFKMGLALLWVAPISFAIVLLSRKLQDKLGSKNIVARNRLAEGIQECLETVSVIKSCNREREYLEKLDKKMDESERAQIVSETTTASLITTGQMFLRLGLATVIVVGNSMVLKNETDLFTYILFLIAASRIFDPLSGAMSNMAEIFNIGLQIDRIKQIVNYKVQSGSNKFKKGNYDITFKNVEFSYEKGKSVLEDVSFTAKMGEVTALVGPSGGGKSTIAKLAARFHDIDEGHIFLGENDISKINPEVLLENFSFVFQDVVLFNNTIMENIRMGRQSASDEEVIEAAKAARCAEFIKELPDGYNTIVGENGSTLSGGECQRLSIARALLKDAPVILLDEATASLDVDSETKVQSAISRLIKGKTVLVIAHRMRTIEAADKIVVLSDGKVAEEGTHHTLMRKKGIYNRMVNLQMSSDSWKLKSEY
ncbi:ABC transporter ATP-binding protein [Clostridium sp. ZBS2]|uniref:ABC transporter ATP-binding protein n=1 Tax=Clostridium sp. ZBS2 TaxID=2949976 RepID=UPI00207932E0|nr:ABC transporter ATP-binding protein [Clostridium sp. ZBS2]